MDTERIKKILNSDTSVKATNTDVNLKVNLEAKERLLPPDKIDHIVDVGDQFNTERQNSPFYRILGTINPLISNVLFNLNNPSNFDLYTWAGFNFQNTSATTITINGTQLAPHDYLFLDTAYPRDNALDQSGDLTYAQAIKSDLKEIEGWFGFFDPDITKSALCNYYDMEPKRQRFSFVPDIAPYNCTTNCGLINNWDLTITYPASTDTTHYIVNNGLIIFDQTTVTISGRKMIAFGTPVLHNLLIGDTVRLTGTTNDGDYPVVRTGLDDGSLKGYYFVVDVTPITTSVNSRMIKIIGGVPSNYYFRKFKKVTTRNTSIIDIDDYETYKLAFSENIYFDSISQAVFNEDVMVSGLTDNLGRPLSELYFTVIKTDSNKLFGKVSSGIEIPYMNNLTNKNIPVINRIHNGGTGSTATPFPSHIPLETNVLGTNNDFYGDVVEYNGFTVQETVLANVAHRFNTINRESPASALTLNYVSAIGSLNPSTGVFSQPITTTISLGPRQEGYYYRPHNLIKIRDFSVYVEQGDTHTGGIPSYAENLGDGRYLWRDLLDIGFTETGIKPLDYPFLNGCHYMYQNISFNLKRQDPFDNWNLYHSKFPADQIGERTTSNYTVNSATNVC